MLLDLRSLYEESGTPPTPTTIRRYYHGRMRHVGGVWLAPRFYYVDEAA